MKKKIALFYDQNTESGRMILDFLTPFDKRKSDIVGQLILNWIAEHGATVPVEWLGRKGGELGGELSLPVRPTLRAQASPEQPKTSSENPAAEGAGKEKETGKEEVPHDKGLILAGLSSFMGQKGE